MKRLALVLLILVPSLRAQAPQNWGGAGASYNQAATPQVSGWGAFATLLSNSGPIYSFTEYQITSAKTKPWTAQTSTTTGIATPLKVLLPSKDGTWTISVFGMATGGLATSQSTVSGAFAGGGVGIIRVGKTNWDIVLGAQFLSTAANKQTVYSFGIGRSF